VKNDFLLSSMVVAMASGTMAAVYVLRTLGHGPFGEGPLWEEMIAVALMPAPYVATAVGLLVAGVALVMRRLRIRRARWLSRGPWISAALAVVGSLLLFGPVGGFHHMIRFVVLGYAIVDCDSPPEDLPVPFGRCGIRSSAVLLVVTIAVWISLVLLLNLLLRLRALRRAGFAAEDDREGGR
jgi:hypothetical protein